MANRATKNVAEVDSGAGKTARKTKREAMARFLELRRKGLTVGECMERLGYHERTYWNWRRSDSSFRVECDRIAARRKGDRVVVPDFPEFCATYLGMELSWHQLQWFDILEGREPRQLHPAETYEPGHPTHFIVNTPPEHAKSTTITVAYVLWRVLKDPNELVLIVSANSEMAADWLTQIKEFLTGESYAELQRDFAPEEGFKAACTEWQAKRIRFGSELGRDRSAANPTVEAVGIGKAIYGKRCTLAILDDCVNDLNAANYEKQFNWITRMVLTRVGHAGTCLVVGSRVAPMDLYRALRDPARYAGGVSEWTYLAQPAVLEFADDPADWKTLWPRSNMPQVGDTTPVGGDGAYTMWDGPRLHRKRGVIGETAWAQGYMQLDIEEDATFPREAVAGCTNGLRKVGLLNSHSGPPQGMKGMYVVAGLDPATSGYTAIVVLALDRNTGKRWVLDVFNQANMRPDATRSVLKDVTLKYSVAEWRVEANAFQRWLSQDREMKQWMAARGVIFDEHLTYRNKSDPDFGVASMAGLFWGWEDRNNLIELPSVRAEGVRALHDQLISWAPQTTNVQDCVMALWFADLRARELVLLHNTASYLDSNWMSAGQRQAQAQVIDVGQLGEYAADDEGEMELHMASSWN